MYCCYSNQQPSPPWMYVERGPHQQVQGIKVDLLICCGDFQCLRSRQDYAGLACPDKYKTLVSEAANYPIVGDTS